MSYPLEFVAMPLGQGYTVEGQITGKEVGCCALSSL